MNSLPLISHRLFVAAVGSLGRPQAKPGRRNLSVPDAGADHQPALRPARSAAAIPLEVLADSRFVPIEDQPRLHVSALAGG